MKASERYRDIGIICAYIAFNYFLCFATFYLFRIHAWGKTKSGSVAKAGAKKGEEAVAATSAQASGVPPNEKITEQLPVSSLIDPPGGNVPVQDPKSVQERSA